MCTSVPKARVLLYRNEQRREAICYPDCAHNDAMERILGNMLQPHRHQHTVLHNGEGWSSVSSCSTWVTSLALHLLVDDHEPGFHMLICIIRGVKVTCLLSPWHDHVWHLSTLLDDIVDNHGHGRRKWLMAWHGCNMTVSSIYEKNFWGQLESFVWFRHHIGTTMGYISVNKNQ